MQIPRYLVSGLVLWQYMSAASCLMPSSSHLPEYILKPRRMCLCIWLPPIS